MTDELAVLDATAQAELVGSGEVKPVELVEAAIRRIEERNVELNAVIHRRFDQALGEARDGVIDGPFGGVPFLFKDYSCASAGDPHHAGMSFLKRHGWRESEDSFLARRFRAAGLIQLGRTNTPELAVMGTTEPASYGPTRNPWDPSRSPGGSSGGSAAAVAAGLVPAAHANDGAGSIRIPASCCGLVGLKSSRGRISAGPGPESLGAFAVEGVVTTSVRDAAGILDAVRGPMTGDPHPAPLPERPYVEEVGADPGRLRIGLLVDAPSGVPVDEQCREAARTAAGTLEGLGHVVEDGAPDGLFDPGLVADAGTRVGASVAAQLDLWAARIGEPIGPDDVEPLTWLLAEGGRATSAPALAGALGRLQVLSRKVASWWEDGFDLLLSPTLATPVPPLGWFHDAPDPETARLRAAQMITFTQPCNVTGQPAVSLPLATDSEGLPLGIQLVAAPRREDLLLRVAAQLEQAVGWPTRAPDPAA